MRWCCFFFQAEDGIRDAQESRGLGDVYKRQVGAAEVLQVHRQERHVGHDVAPPQPVVEGEAVQDLSLIHI